MTDGLAPEPSLIPPESFVNSFNAGAFAHGRPLRTALDPLVMMAWHLATESSATSPCLGLPPL